MSKKTYTMSSHLWAKVGDHVYYDGREGEVLKLDHVFNGVPTLCLVDVDDVERTCTAIEDDCVSYECYMNGNALSKSGIQY